MCGMNRRFITAEDESSLPSEAITHPLLKCDLARGHCVPLDLQLFRNRNGYRRLIPLEG